MNYVSLILAGLLATMAYSWYGFVYKNFREIGRQDPVALKTGQYPARGGFAKEGQDVYRAQGCASCHTMQVRAKGYSDIPRYGARISVLQDFLTDEQLFLGQVRIGPDLTNIGLRQPDAQWHYEHLYAPKSKVPKSTMPPFPYLFETRKIKGARSAEALNLAGDFSPPAGYEVVPTRQAQALVAYLRSLRADVALFEAPLPQPNTNDVPAEANASTNAAPTEGAQDNSPQ
ncbi:MAG: cbb3-type cytochrome c oxidase subunit II [Verrucomicrobiales bacterium]